MTTREQFTPEEWTALIDVPLLAGVYMMAVSPQGLLGVFREFSSLRLALIKMLSNGAYYELIDGLRQEIAGQVEKQSPLSPEHFQTEDQMRKYVLDHCRRATQALYQKATEEESSYYRRGVLWICQQVAQAAREGGVFGIKSVQVTEEEHQAVRQVAFALGISAQEAVVETLPIAPQREVPRSMEHLFNPQEWELLREAPVWVTTAITGVSPNSALGVARELTALAHAMQQVVLRYPTNRLITALFDDMSLLTSQSQPAVEVNDQLSAEEAAERAVELCRQTRELVDRKVTPQEAQEYKEMMLFLARQIAEGAKEGGVLGIGSKRISEKEQTVLQEISAALNASKS